MFITRIIVLEGHELGRTLCPRLVGYIVLEFKVYLEVEARHHIIKNDKRTI